MSWFKRRRSSGETKTLEERARDFGINLVERPEDEAGYEHVIINGVGEDRDDALPRLRQNQLRKGAEFYHLEEKSVGYGSQKRFQVTGAGYIPGPKVA